MNKKKLYNFFGSLRKKMETLLTRTRRVAVNLTVVEHGNSQKILDREAATKENIVALVRSNIDIRYPPDSFSIEFLDADKNYIFLDKREFVFRRQPKPDYKNKNLGEIPMVVQSQQSISLGEVEEIFQKKWQEKQQEQEIQNLRQNVKRLERDIRNRDNDKSELELKIRRLEDDNTELEDKLEAKNKLKYYANILGITLNGIGINKNMLRQPLRGLLEETEQQNVELEEKIDDESGIIEENETGELNQKQQQREEAITLVAQYLSGTDDDTLARIYYIFSEIEQDNQLAVEIIKFLEARKEENVQNQQSDNTDKEPIK